MANFGKFFLFLFITLFALRAIAASVLPFHLDVQELTLEEGTENEAQDSAYEMSFFDALFFEPGGIQLSLLGYALSYPNNYKTYRCAYYQAHIPPSLRPPSIA